MTPDINEVKKFLTQKHELTDLEILGSGEWSTAFRFQSESRGWVARFGQHPEDFRKDRRAFELYGEIVPVPRIVEIGEAFDGLFYAVSEWFPGERLDRLPEGELRAAQPSLLRALNALRVAPLPTPSDDRGYGWWTEGDLASHETWAEVLLSIVRDEEHPRVAGWKAFLATNADGSRAFEAAGRRLEEVAVACPDDIRSLLHGDLTAGNVLIEGANVSAVIDWGNSLLGDPLYDVAWLVFWSPWHPGLDAEFILSQTRRSYSDAPNVRLENFDERLLACYLQIGLDSMAYNAFRRSEMDLNATIERLRGLAGGAV